ncbi:FecR domain-containing protein [Chryseolinea lacunae]|uniref:FecR domain-containing protein n=1 Tax=Chryseolinea lacunae TaxID=2801331 RepID=A0ABS1KLM1_9BACT|nr:FecR domain-containing protein [Chryseolinea lacunae]MBL0740373.1 FecR domain-containing protein [Chryseolinea lacunae]
MNTDLNLTLEKISAYLSGQLTAAERETFETWLNASDENRQLFHDTKIIWEASNIRHTVRHADTEAELTKFMQRIRETDAARDSKIVHLFKERPWIWKVAATLLFTVLASYVLFFHGSTTEFDLSSGNRVMMVYLPDSTKVWLNTNSRISYTKDFHGPLRWVYLEGEAYFQVTPNPNRPFEVITKNTLTRVLGTSFNVNVEDTLTTLSVAEGKVLFGNVENPKGGLVLTKKESASYSSTSHMLERSSTPALHIGAWREKNNPDYEQEARGIATYLSHRHTWKKNPIHQSVIEGELKNTAAIVTYKNIVLRVSYAKAGGAERTTHLTISEPVHPGETIDYKRRLLDIFTETAYVNITIESAEVVLDDRTP